MRMFQRLLRTLLGLGPALGRACVLLSLGLMLVTVFCFWRQPDRLAAFTVMPIWLWGFFGISLATFACYFLRARYSPLAIGLWVIVIFVGSDEARVFTHFDRSAPLPGPPAAHDGRPVIRVITLNCATGYYGNPAADFAGWQPDVVLLQDILPFQAQQIAITLYGNQGGFRAYRQNAIISRWPFVKETITPGQPDQQATVRFPGGHEIEIVNVHLATAATDLRLWRRSAWANHRANRKARKAELATTFGILKTTTQFPDIPVIFGGDFNAPATDVVFRQLSPDLVDAFATAGTGWGNTFQRRLPVLRIDHLFATRHFSPVRSTAAVTRHSDHRMVIADFQTAAP